MKKKTKNELMKLKETFINVFDEFNTTEILTETKTTGSYIIWYNTITMYDIDVPYCKGERNLFDVIDLDEDNEDAEDYWQEDENGHISPTGKGHRCGIGLWDPDGDGDVIFECFEDEIKEVSCTICDWIEEHVEEELEEIERNKNIVDAYNSYTPFERFKEDYTWSEFKEEYDLPKSWSIAAFKKEAKRATIKLIGKV